MALFDIFKKTEEPKKPETKKPKAKKPPKVSVAKKKKKAVAAEEIKIQEPEQKKPVIQKHKDKISDLAYRILKEPHVTEKATNLAKANQYIFKVYPRSNKAEIKKAVEDLYGVDVASVNIIKIPPKKMRVGKTKGWSKELKKAIVKLKEGQTIEILPH